MHAHGALIFATAPKQITQCKVQFRRVRVVLHRLNERVNGLVLLLVEQKIQTLEVGFGRLTVFHAQLPQVQA